MEHLGPCPFCGGRAEIFSVPESGTCDVQCQQCGAMPYTIDMRAARAKGIGKDEARDILARRWNGDADGMEGHMRRVEPETAMLAMLTGRRYAPVNKCRVDVGDTHIRCRACGAFMARDGLTDLCGPIAPRYCAACGSAIEWGDAR